MKLYRIAAGAAVALMAVGCGNDAAPASGDAALAVPDGQLAMATDAGLTHRPADAGPIQVYKSPT